MHVQPVDARMPSSPPKSVADRSADGAHFLAGRTAAAHAQRPLIETCAGGAARAPLAARASSSLVPALAFRLYFARAVGAGGGSWVPNATTMSSKTATIVWDRLCGTDHHSPRLGTRRLFEHNRHLDAVLIDIDKEQYIDALEAAILGFGPAD